MVIVLFGVSGVGKGSILSRALEDFKEWKVVNYGSIMLKHLESLGLKRDEMRKKLDLRKYVDAQKNALEELKGIIERNKRVIVDTHASIILHKYGFYPGFPGDSIREINPTVLVLITANPYEIYGRRYKDYVEGKRERELNIDLIKKEVEMERRYSIVYSVISGRPLKIINNKQGMLDKAVEEFKKILGEVDEILK